MISRMFKAAAIALAAAGIAAAPAIAQSYPSKPITLIIPFAPGGSVDAVVRAIKPHLEQKLGQPIVVDYRAGAATTVGTGLLARSAPDGYTLGMVVDAHTVNPSLYKSLPYNTLTDFAPITLVGTIPLVVTVNAASQFDSFGKLIEVAKSKPNTVTYATVGKGSINHLAAELLSRVAKIQMTHVPYRGGGPAVTDLLGGHVDMMMMSVTLARPNLDAGKFRAIAVTSEERVPSLPNVPTVAESGMGKFNTFAWQGILAPAKTPPEIVARVQRDVKAVLEIPSVREALGQLGFTIKGSTSAEFDAFIKADVANWADVVRDAKIEPEG